MRPCLATPARNQRGPFCYDCDHVGRVEDCHRVTLCKSDQVNLQSKPKTQNVNDSSISVTNAFS